MNNLSTYIIEKLKINKDSKPEISYPHIVDEILGLCDIKLDDNATIRLITDWVNQYKFKHLVKITDLTYLKRDGQEKLLTHREKFKDEPERARKIYTDLIIDKGGNEVPMGGWNDPKIYYNNDILIFHDYKKYNLDKIFIKEK